MIHFTNTLSGKKEEFKLSSKLSLYVCGITPYDHAHVGHGRCYVSFDIINRLLSFIGEPPIYCRNFTDVDDKLLRKAEQEYGDRLRFREVADRYIASFGKDMAALNCLSPQIEPRVTDNIPPIISFIEKLIASGHAYQSGGDVYFAIDSFPEYGKLSKQNKNQLYEGVRVDSRDDKRNPLDFALWKSEPTGEFWQSPWGYGRPGWHIECSVLARTYLGEHIDIHGGGLDLIFPHHENEIAQSESLYGAPFAHTWIHNGFVTTNKEKMSKSLGNFFVLHELFEQFDPMVVRYYFITHHYRSPIEFSFDLLRNAQKSYERIVRIFQKEVPEHTIVDYDHDTISYMLGFLQDDLNTPGLLGIFFEQLPAIVQDPTLFVTVRSLLVNVLGLTLEPCTDQEVEVTPEIQLLIDERKLARHNKNWARADELRDQLKDMGVDIQDDRV